MSFDVRPYDYVSVGPGTPVTIPVDGETLCNVTSPVTNLVNGNTYVRDVWESFYQSSQAVSASPVTNRLAIGYRVGSDFRGFTNDPAVPMVWDVSIAAQAAVKFSDTTAPRVGPVGISVWLHIGEVDGDTIVGGRASVLGVGETSVMEIDSGRQYVNCAVNFKQSVVVYPAFLAFQAAPLALAVVVSYPEQEVCYVQGFAADVQARLYSGVQKVFDPAQQ